MGAIQMLCYNEHTTTVMYWKCTEAMNVMMYDDNFLFGPELNHLNGWTHRQSSFNNQNYCNPSRKHMQLQAEMLYSAYSTLYV